MSPILLDLEETSPKAGGFISSSKEEKREERTKVMFGLLAWRSVHIASADTRQGARLYRKVRKPNIL